MDPKKNELKARLLAQQVPHPERLAAYRKEVEAMLEKVDRNRWAGLVYAILIILGVVGLLFGAFALGLVAFYFAANRDATPAQVLVPASAAFVFLLAGAAMVRFINRRNSRTKNLLLEVKTLETRLREIEETERGRAGK